MKQTETRNFIFMNDKLNISELYLSIQGEGTRVGEPCVIVRLAGCNLECVWCDTPQSRETKSEMTIAEIIDFCTESGLNQVLVTGGEPLIQDNTPLLLSRLVDSGFEIILETNGSFTLEGLPSEVVIILDYKCSGSGMSQRMDRSNIDLLKKSDEMKFVLLDDRDFTEALEIVQERNLCDKTSVLFSPVFGEMDPSRLAEMILETRLPIRLNLQVHKYIWGQDSGGH